LKKAVHFIICISVFILSGCAELPLRPKTADVNFTDSYARQYDSQQAEQYGPFDVTQSWWHYYESDDLNALIAQALTGNPNLNQTRKRFEQAAASSRRSFSELLPDVTATAGRTKDFGDSQDSSGFSLRGAASYELDLWGGNRALYQSNDLEAIATGQEVQSITISLTASIVENWLTILSLKQQEALLSEQLETNDMILDLQFKRYASGVAEALDVLQQQEVLERTRALLPDIKSDLELTQHQLAILVGQNPSLPVELTGEALPKLITLPDTGIPAALLENRPDVKAAWFRVASADWASEAARIDRLPALNIGADYATVASGIQGLFNSWVHYCPVKPLALAVHG